MNNIANTKSLTMIASITGIMMGVIFAVVGAALGLAGWLAIEATSPPEGGIITDAVVVDVEQSHAIIDGIAVPTFAPVYVYEDLDGTSHRVVDRISQAGDPPRIGSTVEVSYLPGDPGSVRRTGLVADWMFWLMWGGIAGAVGGVLMAVAGAATGASAARRRRHARPSPVMTW